MKVFGEIFARILSITVVLGLFLLALGCVAKFKSDGATIATEHLALINRGALIEGRRFYVGDNPSALMDKTISVGRINFLDDLRESDPVLSDWGFFVRKYGMPIGERLKKRDFIGQSTPLTSNTAYLVQGYDVTERMKATPIMLDLYPEDVSAGYYVSCHHAEINTFYWDCTIYADYPHQPRLTLQHHFGFSEALQVGALQFPIIAARMRYFVGCLDVTEKPFPQSEAAFLAAHPTMSDCI